jgi:thiol-disulfide isomerase/thioredoxin
MRIRWATLAAVLGLLAVASGRAGEFLPILKVGGGVYSNVTVTSVTATDIYFSHTKGMGNAKLKNLPPDLQKRFNFDAAKSSAVEKRQGEASAIYFSQAATNKPPRPQETPEDEGPPVVEENGDPVVTKLYARSFRGQRPPQIIVDQWLTPSPDATGKFVLVDFWATWCAPCRESIPHLNGLQDKFKDRLVVIGLSDEEPDVMKKMTTPRVNYYVGTDTQARTRNMAEVRGIPHALLIDPKGIVRFEGQPVYLDEKSLERLIAKYSN